MDSLDQKKQHDLATNFQWLVSLFQKKGNVTGVDSQPIKKKPLAAILDPKFGKPNVQNAAKKS